MFYDLIHLRVLKQREPPKTPFAFGDPLKLPALEKADFGFDVFADEVELDFAAVGIDLAYLL